MKILAHAILLIYVLVEFRRIIRITATDRWRRRKLADLANDEIPLQGNSTLIHLVVLLPVLREQAGLKIALSRFARIPESGYRLSVVVVATEKERVEREQARQRLQPFVDAALAGRSNRQLKERFRGLFPRDQISMIANRIRAVSPQDASAVATQLFDAEPTTGEMARQLCDELNSHAPESKFYVINYPGTAGRKGSQLNYAIANLRAGGIDPPPTYFCIYDIDSIPDARTFRFVAQQTIKRDQGGTPPSTLLLETMVPLNTDISLPKGLMGSLLSGHILFQVRRAIGVEMARPLIAKSVRRATSRLARALLRPMIYGVGSGLILRACDYDRVGPFPEPHDDLAIGYRASLLNANIEPIPFCNLVQPFTSVNDLWRSYSWACFGSLSVLRDTRGVMSQSPLRGLEKRLLIAKELLDTLLWFLGPPLVLAAILVGPYTYLILLAILMIQYSEAMLLRGVRRRLLGTHVPGPASPGNYRSILDRTFELLLYPLQPLVHMIGSWYLVGTWTKGMINRKGMTFGKTER